MSHRWQPNPGTQAGTAVVRRLHVHLVFVTNYRRGAPDEEILTRSSTTRRPSPRPGRSTPLKGVSSRGLREEYVGRINPANTPGHPWSPTYYAASCGAAALEIVKEHIRGQQRPD